MRKNLYLNWLDRRIGEFLSRRQARSLARWKANFAYASQRVKEVIEGHERIELHSAIMSTLQLQREMENVKDRYFLAKFLVGMMAFGLFVAMSELKAERKYSEELLQHVPQKVKNRWIEEGRFIEPPDFVDPR